MSIIEKKLVESYSVLVRAGKYILREEGRENESQKLVPERFIDAVEIKLEQITNTNKESENET